MVCSHFSAFFCCYLMRNSPRPSVLLSPLILFPSPSISKALLLISRSPFFSVSSLSAPAFDSSGAEHASGLPERDQGDFFPPLFTSCLSHCLSFPFQFLAVSPHSPTPSNPHPHPPHLFLFHLSTVLYTVTCHSHGCLWRTGSLLKVVRALWRCGCTREPEEDFLLQICVSDLRRFSPLSVASVRVSRTHRRW